MQYLEYAVASTFMIAGLWLGYQTFHALGTDSILVDIDGQKVELDRSRDPDRFKSAIRFKLALPLAAWRWVLSF